MDNNIINQEREVQRLLQKQRVLFFITIFRPYQPSSGLQMLLNLCNNHNIIIRWRMSQWIITSYHKLLYNMDLMFTTSLGNAFQLETDH